MLKLQNLIIVLALAVAVSSKSVRSDYDEEAARSYLEKVNVENGLRATESVLASWAYESNITDETLQNQLEVSARLANYTKEVWQETIKYPWQTYQDPDVKRQFQKLSVLGTAALSPEKYEQLDKIINDMQGVYGKAKVCDFYNRTNCELQLEPEITERLVKSRDPDELKYLWIEWRKVSGQPVRNLYVDYVNLSNEAAVLNNFTDNAAFWLKDYEADDFKDQVEALWQQLRPLYLQLHAYVRRRLREQYGEEIVSKTGPIPAHLLGNMWAQTWGNIVDFTVPYPNKPSVDVTPNMVEQGYTPLKMFQLAEEFFTSLNLSAMPETFWNNSIIEKPNDGRDLICHASAWDFYDGKDFRIKQCTRTNMEDLQTVHHEMGHVQYFLQYKDQPHVYKEGANPGFHEAVGDVMALSVSTPKHLRKIGLLNTTDDDEESDINQLYNMALDKIAFLPFGYLMDQWRWGVFQGETSSDDYNCKWWELREKYQGLEPPVDRSENDFDPGAKYHIVASVPYIRYFVSFVVQFQFHRSLCTAAGEFDPQNPDAKPLHKCDIYQSKEAGELLGKMLQMGSSKPWPDAMEVLTGQRNMDAGALLQYFATLQDWLEKENARTGEYIGWEPTKRQCTKTGGKNAAKTPKPDGAVENFNFGLVSQDEYNNLPDNFEESQPLYHTIFRRSLPSDVYYKRKLTRSNDITGPSRNSLLTSSDKKSHEKNKKKIQNPEISYGNDIYSDCLTEVLEEEIRLAREILENPGDEELLKRYASLQNGGAEVLKNKCILKRWHRDKDKKGKSKEHVKPAKVKEPVKLKENPKVKEEEKEKFKAAIKPESPFENVNKQPEPQPEPQQPEPQPQPQQPEPQPQYQFQRVPQPLFQPQQREQSQFQSQQQEPQIQYRPQQREFQQPEQQELNRKTEKAFVPKYFVNTFSQQRPDVDLIWNAEMVKNQAKQTIKNLKYLPQAYDPNLRSQKGFTILKMENPKYINNKRSHATVTMESGSEKHIADAKQRLESLQNLLKSAGLMSEIAQANREDFNNNNYNSNVVPRYVNGYLNEGDVVIINEPNPLLNDKRVKKKSYREFHYNVRTPVCYNSIIIQGCKDNKKQTDEKTAKPGEKNTDGGVTRKRNARELSSVNRKFYKSVRWKRKTL